ncbi:thioesterase domain-containing protein [Streptomyces sp. NPDC047860]|uniref:thioesterase II family protein n=1 Tax=Streptomyces sp. NPDC047860 TaxID=3155743 RepID=UPI0033EA8943
MSQTSATSGTDRALQKWTPRPHTSAVVYALAHAGAGAAPWNPVAAALPSHLELRALRLPGRENRIAAEPHTSVASAAAEVAGVIAADADAHGKPVLLAGSCFGAMIALAALGLLPAHVPVRGLVALRQPIPGHVAPASGDRPSAMSTADLRIWLRDYRLTPAALLDDDAVFAFFEPLLRSDLSLTDGYAFTGSPLDVPVFLLRTASPQEDLDSAAWGRATSAAVRVHDVAVDGDPLTEAPTVLAEAIAAIAATAVPAGAASPLSV